MTFFGSLTHPAVFPWFCLAIGLCVGSFLNVVIYRVPRGKALTWPSSRCGACLAAIRLVDNIPLLSYWILRGRCRSCGARFSIRYFLVELFTGLAFAGIFYLDVVLNVGGAGRQHGCPRVHVCGCHNAAPFLTSSSRLTHSAR